ncbi:MAG: phage major capsid protein, partial [Gemmataceae bacterium]|nr:phage major capsid protein [Gemmataceae bacterium]
MFVQLTREYLGRPPGERIDVSEADAKRLIDAGLAVAVADDAIGPAVARAFESALGRFGEALTRSVDGALTQFADAQRRSRRNAAPLLFGEDGGDPKGRSFGDWLLCVRRNDARTLATKYDSHLVDWEAGDRKAALNTQSGTQGGYTVPAEFLPRLMQLASESAVVRPRATVIPMASRSIH